MFKVSENGKDKKHKIQGENVSEVTQVNKIESKNENINTSNSSNINIDLFDLNNSLSTFKNSINETNLIKEEISKKIGDNLNAALSLLFDVKRKQKKLKPVCYLIAKLNNTVDKNSIDWKKVSNYYKLQIEKEAILENIYRIKNKIACETAYAILTSNDDIKFAAQILDDSKVKFNNCLEELEKVKNTEKEEKHSLLANIYKFKIKYVTSFRYISSHYSVAIKKTLNLDKYKDADGFLETVMDESIYEI